jgi:glycosyltransferase involved in cell wall biosynthesis
MAGPATTAVIDTYNHERVIEQAIVSVVEQDIPVRDMQVIVVDDGSTDGTPDIVRKFEPRVRLIRKTNGGQASAFNAAIAEAKGEIVAFLDGDDWWAKGKITAVVDAFDQNPGIAAVGHGYFEVVGDLPTGEMIVPEQPTFVDLSTVEAARIADPARMLLGTSRLAVRRQILQRIGPISNELIFCADTPIFVLALAMGGALILDQPLCYYRLHSPAESAEENASQRLSAEEYNRMVVKQRDLGTTRFLLRTLPPRLVELGIVPEVVVALFESDRLALERFQLQRDGGARLQTFRAEMQSLHSEYRSTTIGYKVFKGLIGSLALLLPPQRFYNLRDWYSHRTAIHRLRSVFGHAEPIVPQSLFQRRRLTPGQK